MHRVDSGIWFAVLGIAAVPLVAGIGLLLNPPQHPAYLYPGIAWGLVGIGILLTVGPVGGLAFNARRSLRHDPFRLDRGLALRRPEVCLTLVRDFKRQLGLKFMLQPVAAASAVPFDRNYAEALLDLFWESFPSLKKPMEQWNRNLTSAQALPNAILRDCFQQAIASGLARSETELPIYDGRDKPTMSGAATALHWMATLYLNNMPYIANWDESGLFLRYMGMPIVNMTAMTPADRLDITRRLMHEIDAIPNWPEIRQSRALAEERTTLKSLLDAQFTRIEMLLGG